MKRWNGWGSKEVKYPLSGKMINFLHKNLGSCKPLPDCTLDEALAKIPKSRFPNNRPSLIGIDPEIRLRHSCGQSVPNWLSMKSGKFNAYPDGVAFPKSNEHVRLLLDWCKANQIKVIPYGGGTSVLGHVDPMQGQTPVLTISLENMNQLIDLDKESCLARFGAGITGIDLEEQLRPSGYLLGHYPQSFEYSTLGGWIATRSCGQQSIRYGRIEKLFAGGRVETLEGTLDIPAFPASAAGIDIRDLMLGSEGRVGVITEAIVRISPIPYREEFYAFFFRNWQQGLNAVRDLNQSGVPLAMLRLSNAKETHAQLMLGGHSSVVYCLEQWLRLKGAYQDKCMLLIGLAGSKDLFNTAKSQSFKVIKQYKGIYIGTLLGNAWKKNRFRVPYLRESLWEAGYVVDTLETACIWPKVNNMVNAIEYALEDGLTSMGEKVYAFTHLSHSYPQGSSVYTTYLFKVGKSYEETLQRWQKLKAAASKAIVGIGGTISHQHGVGKDHVPYLESEKGPIGIGAIRTLCGYFDPNHLLSPGNLYVD